MSHKMTPLIDADILVYEASRSAEIGWKSGGCPPFDYVESLLINAVNSIMFDVRQEFRHVNPPIMFLSTDNNFRYKLATTVPYKGNRNHKERPFHYENVRAYIKAAFNTIVCDGWEADDGLAMAQNESTIICSRDKDLKMVEGWHYTWTNGFVDCPKPEFVVQPGYVTLKERIAKPKNKPPYKVYTCKGTGLKWFYAQCLMGDTTDNIPGIKSVGAKMAYELINPCKDEEECYKIVRETYIKYGGSDELLLEQARLLWMVREKNKDGTLKMWRPPV